MIEQLAGLFDDLPDFVGGHMVLTASALALGLLVSLPLGIFASRRPKLGEWALSVAGVFQTIPSLALLALMVPLLGGMIGFAPAFLALTLYSILPILANTVIGIRGVDPDLLEAARGLGMTERQMLLRVQLPVAAPVILGGVRTATVLVVGTATLVTPVGGKSLGNYIFAGLESFNPVSTVFGCVFAALLAIVLDQLIHLLRAAAERRSRPMAWSGGVGLLVVTAGSLYYPVVRLLERVAAPAAEVAGAAIPDQPVEEPIRWTGAMIFEHLAELFREFPLFLGGHMVLTAGALAVGLLVSIPLGIFASRRPKLGECALGVAGVIQTVPSLALLALMVPLLAGEIGSEPAFVALTLYSILPILANTVIGIRGVDPNLMEAARGVGMNERQVLLRVQLPLAAPVILGGVRTASVLVVGTATLVTPVGGRSLGSYIFGGLQSLNHLSTILGCVFAALLAIVLDQLIRLLEVAARQRSRPKAWAGAAGLLFLVAGSLYYPVSSALVRKASPAVIASAPFTEQHILNEMIALHLTSTGVRADSRRGMSEGILFEALFRGKVDCIIEYTGNIWTLVMKREDIPPRQTILDEVKRYLLEKRGGVECFELGFADDYAFAMEKREADDLGIDTIEDLAQYARTNRIRIGGDMMFFGRPEWEKVRAVYPFKDARSIETVPMDPTLMYGAVVNGQVDVIVAYTSDGRIPAYELKILADPREAFPPYDVVLLLSSEAARRRELIDALRPLLGNIALPMMQDANRHVDLEKWTRRRAAEELLNRVTGQSANAVSSAIGRTAGRRDL